jgi:hypothetical protein
MASIAHQLKKSTSNSINILDVNESDSEDLAFSNYHDTFDHELPYDSDDNHNENKELHAKFKKRWSAMSITNSRHQRARRLLHLFNIRLIMS